MEYKDSIDSRGAKRRRNATLSDYLCRAPSPIIRCPTRLLRLAARRWLIGTAFLLSSLLSTSTAAPYGFCYDQLQKADADSNDKLSSTEFGTAVQYLSGGHVTQASVQTVYDQSLTNGVFSISGIRTLDASTNAFCVALYGAIIAAQTAIVTTEGKCFFAMVIGDSNRDGQLARQVEYPRFANQESGNKYGFSTAYDGLPATVQAVFDDFADPTIGTINIVGAKSSDTMTVTQQALLTALCQEIVIAILAADGLAAPVAAPVAVPLVAPVGGVPVAAPAAAPTTGGVVGVPAGFTPSYTYAICLRMLVFSDVSRDDTLDTTEYYAFLNRLSSNTFSVAGTYDGLPAALQANFHLLAGSGSINVFGSKPRETASQDDTTRLENICTQTDVAIQAAKTSAVGAPAPTPTMGGISTAPTSSAIGTALPFDTCTKDMIIADLSRDNLLSDQEFVHFVSRNDANVKAGDDFSTLPQNLQDVFNALAQNGQIDVTGSKPNESPTAEQLAHLHDICSRIGAALSGSASDPASLASGNTTIYNSFLITNTVQLSAANLQTGPDRDGLNAAYASFIEFAIANFTGQMPPGSASSNTTNSARRYLRTRRRWLPVTGVQPNSAYIYLLSDLTCPNPANEGNAYCQTVFASFNVDFTAMSPDDVSTELTNFTQKLIDPLLYHFLLKEYPQTQIRVQGPSEPLQPSAGTSVRRYSQPPTTAGGGSGPNVVRIIAILILFMFLIGGGVYFLQAKRRKRKFKTASDKTDLDGSFNGQDDGALDTIGYGVESALSPEIAKIGIGKGGVTFDESGADDDGDDDGDDDDDDEDSVGFSVQDQSPLAQNQQEKSGGKRFKSFGLKKKKRSGIDDDIGILESCDDFQDLGDDFGNYAFEEPSELQESTIIPTSFYDSAPDGPSWVTQDRAGEWGENAWGVVPSGDQTKNKSSGGIKLGSEAQNLNNNENFTERSGSGSESSGSDSDFDKVSVVSGASGKIGQLEGLVDNGDWVGVKLNATQIESNLNDSVSSAHFDGGSFEGSRSESESTFDAGGVDADVSIENSVVNDPSDERTIQTDMTMTSEEHRRRDEYRLQVEELVRKTAPDELDNISTMMTQFAGREAELINTLQTMYQRSSSQRRLKAVHKSKAIPERDSRVFEAGGAEGSAVIAAASMINAECEPLDYENEDESEDSSFDENASYYGDGDKEEYEDDDGEDYDSKYGEGYDDEYGGGCDVNRSASCSRNEDDNEQDGSNTDSRTGSYDDQERSHSGSYNDQEGSQTGSRSGDRDDDQEGSCTGSQSGSYDDKEGSFTGGRSESYDDQEGSQSGRYDDQKGSLSGSYDNQEGSQRGRYDDQRSRTGCHNEGRDMDQEGSFTGSRSGSYDDHEGSQSGSYDGQEGSQTGNDSEGRDKDQEGSFTESRSGSYDDQEESQIRSYDDQEGSKTGSRSESHSGSRDDDQNNSFTGSGSGSHDDKESSVTSSRSGSFSRNEDIVEGSYSDGE